MLDVAGEAFGDFVRRGLPIVTGVLGAAIANRKKATVLRTSSGAALGWLVGWGLSRATFWFLDLFEPTLPVTQGITLESINSAPGPIPEMQPPRAVAPEVVFSGGEHAKNVTPKVETKSASYFAGAYGR